MSRTGKGKLPRDLAKLSGERLGTHVEQRERLFREARRRAETAGQGRRPVEADRIRETALADAQAAAADLRLLREEQGRRREEAPVRQGFLRMAAASVGADSTHELHEIERAREEAKAREREEQERARAEKVRAQAVKDAKRQHAERVAAGLVWEPVGGWAGGDTLAALLGSQEFWRQFVFGRYGDDRMPLLDLTHIGYLAAALVAIAENGGKPARFATRKWPNLPFGTAGSREEILKHLVANGLLTLVERNGPLVTVAPGPEVERLAEGFRSEMRQRSKPPTVGEEVTRLFNEFKASFGKGEHSSTRSEPA